MSIARADDHAHHRAPAGFTLVEVLVVIAMIGVLAAVTLPIARGMIARAEADSATVALTSALKVARNRAIAERREFEVHFEPPDNLRIARRPVPIGTPETISNTRLENGQTVMRFPGAVDTPDAFGGTGAVNFTGPLPVMFTSDGSLIDSNGDPVNGTIFLGVAGEPDSARAITIFGMTGLARSWKQAGAGWIE